MKVKAMVLMLALAGMAHASVNTSIHVTPESNSQTRVVDQGLSHLQSTQWGLTDEEWARYQDMIRGKTGIQSPGLDPLTTLGIDILISVAGTTSWPEPDDYDHPRWYVSVPDAVDVVYLVLYLKDIATGNLNTDALRLHNESNQY